MASAGPGPPLLRERDVAARGRRQVGDRPAADEPRPRARGRRTARRRLADRLLAARRRLRHGDGRNTPPHARARARDPLTRGVLLDLRGVSGLAQLEELRPRIAALRAAGKPVVAYLEYGGGRGDLYLASACDRIVRRRGRGLRRARPAGRAALLPPLPRRHRRAHRPGLVSAVQVGVPRVQRRLDPRRPTARRSSTTSTWSQDLFVGDADPDRGLGRARVAAHARRAQWPPDEVLEAGLVDSIGDRATALALLGRARRARRAARRRRRPADLAVAPRGGRSRRASPSSTRAGRSRPARSGERPAARPDAGLGDGDRAARGRRSDRPEIEAVVLRVESPGGSSLASALIDQRGREAEARDGQAADRVDGRERRQRRLPDLRARRPPLRRPLHAHRIDRRAVREALARGLPPRAPRAPGRLRARALHAGLVGGRRLGRASSRPPPTPRSRETYRAS